MAASSAAGGDGVGVASGHSATTEAALRVIAEGGNAFDGAVAAGFAAAAAEPALTSLGGGGFLLARRADGRAVLFDFFVDNPGRGLPSRELEPHFVPITVRFPGSDQVFNAGLGSVAVPGNLAGLLHVHERLGRLPLDAVIAPARELARTGVELNERQAYFLSLLEPIVTLTPRGRELFAPGGRYPGRGDRLANPDLAAFLEELPRDRGRDFYTGALARRIGEELHAGQGLLTAEDLASFRVVERRPLATDYRGHRLLTNPPPSFGGPLIALALRLLAEVPCAAGSPDDPEYVLRLLAVMEEVEALRGEGCLEPGVLEAERAETARTRLRRFSRGTTHVSVQDAEGNAASLTTSNGEGSGYVAPGTGIMLNNMLGEDDLHPEGFFAQPPGERVASMMSPSLLLHDDRVRLVLGSGGSKRIRTALLQVIVHAVDLGLPLRDAVERPRLHWDGSCVQVEPGLAPAALDALRRLRPVNEWSTRDVYFGGVHAVGRGEVAGDPRRGGAASSALPAG